MLFGFSFLFAFWCQKTLGNFALKINQQCYLDCHSLVPLPFSETQFQQNSALQPKHSRWAYAFFFAFPLLAIMPIYSVYISFILMILLFLSLIDWLYYLTDPRYVAVIFLLSLAQNLFLTPERLEEHLFTLFCFSIFFGLFSLLTQWIYQKEVFGMGDIFILLALCPLFSLTQFATLLLYASLSALIFALLYWIIKKQKCAQLPFLPFITLAIFGVL